MVDNISSCYEGTPLLPTHPIRRKVWRFPRRPSSSAGVECARAASITTRAINRCKYEQTRRCPQPKGLGATSLTIVPLPHPPGALADGAFVRARAVRKTPTPTRELKPPLPARQPWDQALEAHKEAMHARLSEVLDAVEAAALEESRLAQLNQELQEEMSARGRAERDDVDALRSRLRLVEETMSQQPSVIQARPPTPAPLRRSQGAYLRPATGATPDSNPGRAYPRGRGLARRAVCPVSLPLRIAGCVSGA